MKTKGYKIIRTCISRANCAKTKTKDVGAVLLKSLLPENDEFVWFNSR
ncbi:MAG: hypothetical protein CM15mV114_200 [Caudoviricetes sp.]|nr:MAG: hypothetical protein CM15mV114_200 [Caudoviricetes sp.]